jgi:hypothetical protein
VYDERDALDRVDDEALADPGARPVRGENLRCSRGGEPDSASSGRARLTCNEAGAHSLRAG